MIGSGSFGVVYQARLLEGNESVAIKKVLQDKRFKVWGRACEGRREKGWEEREGRGERGVRRGEREGMLWEERRWRTASLPIQSNPSFPSLQNRELQIMRRLDHCNIIRLQYYFYSAGDKVQLLYHSITSSLHHSITS